MPLDIIAYGKVIVPAPSVAAIKLKIEPGTVAILFTSTY